MCIYSLKVFACSHEQWGPRQRSCIIGREFQEGRLSEDCVYMAPHGLKTTMSSHQCSKCSGASDESLPSPKPLSPTPLRSPEADLEKQLETAAREERERRLLEKKAKLEEIMKLIESRARDERERRFEEDKGTLERIKQMKKNILACYDDKASSSHHADSWIYSENGEIKTSPRHEVFVSDTIDEMDYTTTEAIGLGIFCFKNDPVVDQGSVTSESPSTQGELYTTSTNIPQPITSPASFYKGLISTSQSPTEEHPGPQKVVVQKGSLPTIPKPAPKSRLAIPKSKLQQPRATGLASSLPSKSIKRPETPPAKIPRPVKRPQTPPFEEAKIPQSAPKSRLAVPTSGSPPRYAPTTSTPSKSKLPRPGSATRKLRDSGCSFGSSVGSEG